MIQVTETEAFTAWLSDLRDGRAKAKIAARVQRLRFGNPGDVKSVGEGISEMRIDYGPGYRVYFLRHGQEVFVLLCGGDKGSQQHDIEAAKRLARALKGEPI